MRMNARAERLLRHPTADLDLCILKDALDVIEGGFEQVDGIYLFKVCCSDVPYIQNLREKEFDATETEGLINHLHLDDFVSGLQPAQVTQYALALGLRLGDALIEKFPGKDFFIPISVDNEGGGTIRFHLKRPGSNFLDENLEDYKSEVIILLDTAGIS